MIQSLNTIIVGATGRHTGKTEYACRIIENCRHLNIVGLKVVCFDPTDMACHGDNQCATLISGLNKPFLITEELDKTSDKDTARMLKAGARRSFIMHVMKDSLGEAFDEFSKLPNADALIVAESNSLRLAVEPALFVVIRRPEDNTIKNTCASVLDYADLLIDFNNNQWSHEPQRVFVKNNRWYFRHQATAIILAGGQSSRMGGNNKSFIMFNGSPLIEKVVRQLEPHFEQLLISANYLEKFSFLKLPVIPDIKENMGPLMGILSCLEKSDNDINFITACDIPEISQSLIDRMVFMSGNYDVVMPKAHSDKYEPLYAVYKKNVIPHIRNLLQSDTRKITSLLKHVSARYVDFVNDGWYFNLNRKADLVEYEENKKCKICSFTNNKK